ncbi:ubiquitin-like domain-containing protein [Chloropicon roscoffensis]|uniref:Ubiquitin-like domain-containing protein n=1 Tax=Chloropicon roscoffensis TaxID=1461544 RepID=A0AAX4NXF1_9CHLO
MATTWNQEEISSLRADYDELAHTKGDAVTKYNPTPGTGRTGYMAIPPNNYPFYNDDERYQPVVQPDGGQLSDWKPLYQPSQEQEAEDRRKAYESGVPHGYVPRGFRYEGMPTIKITVQSELHSSDEYGSKRDQNGRHSGGPFAIDVSPKMTVEDLRLVIKEKGGIIPGMQKLAYAGKKLDDPKRTLEHYGIAYWHAKFPDWPITVRKL